MQKFTVNLDTRYQKKQNQHMLNQSCFLFILHKSSPLPFLGKPIKESPMERVTFVTESSLFHFKAKPSIEEVQNEKNTTENVQSYSRKPYPTHITRESAQQRLRSGLGSSL